MSEKYPLISCICISKNKLSLLKRSLTCFLEQTYKKKELLLVLEKPNKRIRDFLAKVNDRSIRVIQIAGTPKKTLGELRNFAISASRGDYICQWDDDDWFHIGRLEYQYMIIKKTGYAGSILLRWLIFDSVTNKAYVSPKHVWEGSLLCKKELFTLKKYENKKKGEDSALVVYLYKHKYLFPVDNLFQLYIYVYHGSNTWGRSHWKTFFKSGISLSGIESKRVSRLLKNVSCLKSSILVDDILSQRLFNY